MEDRQQDTGLMQNAAFIRGTYRKAAFTGMLSILSVNINVFVDGILTGQRIGANALAAINLSMPVYWALCVVGVFFAAGTEIPAARAIGIGNAKRRDAFFSTGLNASVLISLVITGLAMAFRGPLVSFLCADEAIRPYVMEYVVITIIGALPRIVIYIPFWYLRLDGKNTDVAVMMIGMASVNIILDVLFICYMNMGLFGAGLAGTIAMTLACIYGLIRLLAKDGACRWNPKLIHSWKEWQIILFAGAPSAFNSLCSTIRLLILNAMLLGYGGGHLVAVFSAVSGIWGFGECITLGVPAAGSAMLGVFSGEHDNGSSHLLLREEIRIGCAAGVVFLSCSLLLSGTISWLYGLEESLLIPLAWMAVSLFPALLLNILSTYYNMADVHVWPNAIIFLRQILMPWAGLRLTISNGFSLFSFLLFSELSTVAAWWAATGLHHLRCPQDSRWLMADLEHEKNGRVLNFSVKSEMDEIISASRRISAFCESNGMSAGEMMRLEMSMEEVMMLIRQVNAPQGTDELRFDLRAFSINGVRGIRIRYSGVLFNPFNFSSETGGAEDDMFMGVRIIQKMVETINYQSTFGVNTLQILLKEGHPDET